MTLCKVVTPHNISCNSGRTPLIFSLVVRNASSRSTEQLRKAPRRLEDLTIDTPQHGATDTAVNGIHFEFHTRNLQKTKHPQIIRPPTGRQMGKQTDRQSVRSTCRQPGRRTGRRTGRLVDERVDRLADRRVDIRVDAR